MKTIRPNYPLAGQRCTVFALAAVGMLSGASAVSAASLKGQVMGAGEPVAQSTVTLWSASASAPKQLAQVRTDASGRFSLSAPDAGPGTSLYLVAQGGQSAANKAAAITRPSD
jgi:hypothetical protein